MPSVWGLEQCTIQCMQRKGPRAIAMAWKELRGPMGEKLKDAWIMVEFRIIKIKCFCSIVGDSSDPKGNLPLGLPVGDSLSEFQWESASASMPVGIVGSLNPCNMQDSQAKSLKKSVDLCSFKTTTPPKSWELLKITSPKPGRRTGTLSQAGYVVGDSTC